MTIPESEPRRGAHLPSEESLAEENSKPSKLTQDYPTERKDYPNSSDGPPEELEADGKVPVEKAIQIESEDLPGSDSKSKSRRLRKSA